MTGDKMRIRQAFISDAVQSFGEMFINKYGLSRYHSRYAPSVFFGCYGGSRKDIPTLKNHKSLAIVIWRGHDAECIVKNPKDYAFLSRPNIKHIAISSFIEKDLSKFGFDFVSLPISSVNLKSFPICPLGNSIYYYMNPKKSKAYGNEIFVQVRRKLPNYNFITCYKNTTSHENIYDVYKKCFIGLRLTPHDGLSNTVVELGLMGRRCIWNGNLPNAISYTSIEDVVMAIRRESKKTGLNTEIRHRIINYLDIGDGWLDTSYWRIK